ncbi:MAG: inositol monophosphatase family protein [Promethearchaeota archaeon]
MSEYNKEIKYAIEIVTKASEITEWYRKTGINIYKKQDKSPVTMADFASQIYILSELKKIFPKDQVIAEESESNLIDDETEKIIRDCYRELNINEISDLKSVLKYRGNQSKRIWTVDPIDGTIGFQKNLPYALGVCLIEKSVPKICAIAVPDYNDRGLAIFTAELYQGAEASYGRSDFKAIHVSNQKNLKGASMCHSLHYDMPWVVSFADKVGITKRFQLDSMRKFCMIADGSCDIYIKPITGFEAYSWDFAPGDLLVRAAGGMVTDLDEERLVFQDEKTFLRAPGILSTNGILHNEVADIIRNKFFSI